MISAWVKHCVKEALGDDIILTPREFTELTDRLDKMHKALARMVDHFAILPPELDEPGSVMDLAREALKDKWYLKRD